MVAETTTSLDSPPERRIERSSSAPGFTITLSWRLALWPILLLAAFVNFYQLDKVGYANTYYAAAVKSMSENWHNFFFNSFDPGGFVTIDKPPLGFWFQVASVKLFGYGPVSLLLPQALAGVLSVALLYHLVQRVFGRPAGLIAALAMALTPVAVADNRNNIIDSTLVLCMLLGAWAVSVAVEKSRQGETLRPASALRWLLLCAVLVGLGFNVKMLEAYLVVPAFGLLYLLGAWLPWRTRIVHLVLAGVVLLVVSLSWATAVDLTPASQRPWVDSTSSNSELDLAIGYNGLDRLLGRGGPGNGQRFTPTSRTSSTTIRATASGSTDAGGTVSGVSGASGSAPSIQPGAGQGANGSTGTTGTDRTFRAPSGGAGGGPGGLFDNGSKGVFRLFNSQLGSQASWLLALAALAVAVVGSRRLRWPLDRQQQAVVLWGGWLLTVAAFFSVAGFFHSYYLVTLAPPVAALAGIGLVTFWQDYAYSTLREWRGWVLPVALLLTAISQVAILRGYPDWSRWLTPLVLGLTILSAGTLVVARRRSLRRLRLWTPVVAAAGMLALLIAPTAWAADTINNGSAGGVPSAGPSASGGFGGVGRFGRGGFRRFGEGGGFGFPGGQAPGSFPGNGQPPTSGQIPAGGQATAGVQGGASGGTQSGGSLNGRRFAQEGINLGGFVGSGGFPGGSGRGNGASVDSGLLRYLEQHQGTTRYLVVTTNSNSAAPYIIQTGKPVMSLGGFSGSDPILTLAQFQTLVKNNIVRYVLPDGRGFGGQGSGDSISSWVQTSCKAVPSSAYGSSTGSSSSMGGFGGFGGGQQLYDCAGA